MNAKVTANLTTGEVKATVSQGGLQIIYGNAPDVDPNLCLVIGEDDEQDENPGG